MRYNEQDVFWKKLRFWPTKFPGRYWLNWLYGNRSFSKQNMTKNYFWKLKKNCWPIFFRASTGNNDEFQRLLMDGADINAADQNGNTALILAVLSNGENLSGNTKICSCSLVYSVDYNKIHIQFNVLWLPQIYFLCKYFFHLKRREPPQFQLKILSSISKNHDECSEYSNFAALLKRSTALSRELELDCLNCYFEIGTTLKIAGLQIG